MTQTRRSGILLLMSPHVATKRDFKQLEKRRMTAAKLLKQGLSQADVARRVKVSRESVRRWANQLASANSTAALNAAGRAGRKPRLSEQDLERLIGILRDGPEKAGFPTGLWTLDRVAKAIRNEFGVQFHPAHVWWILRRKLKWSCQRPVGRARERNEAAISDWQENIWPALKKKPRKRAELSSS